MRLKEKLPKEKRSPNQEFVYQKQQLKALLDKAVNVISNNITLHKIRFELSEHQRLLEIIERYHQQSNASLKHNYRLHLRVVRCQMGTQSARRNGQSLRDFCE
ncbi:hypothetical protein P4S72_00135 [Vibrio sp. PP-XX7]